MDVILVWHKKNEQHARHRQERINEIGDFLSGLELRREQSQREKKSKKLENQNNLTLKERVKEKKKETV